MPTAVCTSGILATLVAAGHADSMPRLSPAIRPSEYKEIFVSELRFIYRDICYLAA